MKSSSSPNTTVILGLLALSFFVNILQFLSDNSGSCHCVPCSDSKTITKYIPSPDCSKNNNNKVPALHSQESEGEENNNKNDDEGKQNNKNEKDGENLALVVRDNTIGGKHSFNGEIGYSFGTERIKRKTVNTVYDPESDEDLFKKTQAVGGRYARSAIPLPSWKIKVSPSKWVTMDEICFAYDAWFNENQIFQYTSWLGVYMQQDPSDALVIQQMLWQVKPDLVIEIGTNTGGGAVFYSSIMSYYNKNHKVITLDVKEVSNWNKRNDGNCEGCVMGDKHPLWNAGNIHFIQGRVTEEATRKKVDAFVKEAKTVLVIEDASHRYPDTLQNIEAVHQWVSVGSYMLVQDTKMDRFVAGLKMKYGRHKFGPMRSVDEFLKKHDNFVVDRKFEYLMYSQHHRGWLKKIKE